MGEYVSSEKLHQNIMFLLFIQSTANLLYIYYHKILSFELKLKKNALYYQTVLTMQNLTDFPIYIMQHAHWVIVKTQLKKTFVLILIVITKDGRGMYFTAVEK